MRILHVTPYAPAAWAYGGIPRVVGALTRTLARRGHHVTVCATDACEPQTRLVRGTSRTADGVTQHVFPNVSNRLAYRHQAFLPIGLTTFLHRHAQDFDIAHLHAVRNLPGVVAASALRRAGVPYVLAPNGTAPIMERRHATKQVFDLAWGRRVLRGAERVMAVTPAERRQLRSMDVPDRVIVDLPNPIDLDEFSTPLRIGRLRRRLGLTSQPVVMFLGRQTPRKRVDLLARAFAMLGRVDAQLVIAGNDMSDGVSIRSLVSELGIARCTHFVELLRGRDRLEALADADVTVYPSAHEVFGLVPLESLLAGAPVIVADDCGCGEVIGGIGGGLVTRLGDVEALSGAMDTILRQPAAWRASAAAAAQRVRGDFGHDAVTERLERIYASVAAQPSHVSLRLAVAPAGTK